MSERAARLSELVAEQGLDGLIVGDLVRPGDSGPDAIANARWLTGFTGTSALALVGPAQPAFFTDFRYAEQAERQVAAVFERVVVKGKLLAEVASRLSGRIGFDDALTSVANHGKLEAELAEGVELVALTGLVEKLRRGKDAAEVAAIAAAAQLADQVFSRIAERGLAGRTELEVARDAEQRMRELGAEPSFSTIVASGPNGALPHAMPTDRRIADGELVVVDMGAKLDGYCSDGTRTLAAGEVDGEEREVYELVARAQAAGLDALCPGVGGADADSVARQVIADGGHGERFGHGLGHGVGLEVHEAPRLGQRSEDVLAAGEVVTVEPGVYLPGRFGVRIEDLVVIEDGGVRNLSGFTKDLVCA